MKKLIVTVILSFFIALPVNAKIVVFPIYTCNLLNKEGLTTNGWEIIYKEKYGCNSSYKQLGSGWPLANNLAFYVDGTADLVTQVKLILNINDRESAYSAHQKLLKVAKALNIKVTGKQLTQPLKDAIKKGHNATQKIGVSIVEVLRKDWPTGMGYEIQVIIK